MIPQQKAVELYTKYDNLCRDFTKGVSIKEMAKESALIAVDEILLNFGSLADGKKHYASSSTIFYFQEVKQEIEKL